MKQTITLKTADLDELEISMYEPLPSSISINVQTTNTQFDQDTADHTLKFSPKTFNRVGSSLVYEEVL